MSTISIVLPAAQLEGTSATLSKWLVKIGQQVNVGEPLIELETDKVAMEICATEAGFLRDIIASEGEKIEVDTVLGHLDTNNIAITAQPKTVNQAIDQALNQATSNTIALQDTPVETTVEKIESSNSANHLVAPAVRRLLNVHHLNIDNIVGSGRGGRVTRNDVLAYVVNTPTNTASNETSVAPLIASKISPRTPTGTMVPHSNMRKTIAKHMVVSLLETSPHVTSVFAMEMSNIIAHRKWHKKEYAQLDVNLTFTAYFLAAAVKAAQVVPQVNARFHQDALELFSDINIGVATALGDAGIVVPVVQQVQSLNLFAIAKALTTQTAKARAGKLAPSDIKHGTFTISNHGVSGSLWATPIIINQPQVAILGIGKLEKRVVIEEINGIDTMVIKSQCYVSLSIDHRALDAHQTNLFLNHFVAVIENWGQ